MKILLLACLRKNKSGNSFGGAEKSIINMANWLSRQGYDVTLASVEGEEKAFFIENSVDFKGYFVRKTNKILTHFQIFINTQKAIRESLPDVVICFWIHPMFYMLLNPFFRNITKMYSERKDPKLEYGYVAKILRNCILNSVEGIVFQTKSAQNYFRKKIINKSTVIHNPVYIKREEYPICKMDNRLVAVGRLNPQKNFSLLIDAFKELHKDFPELTLEIYGEGPLKTDLQNRINYYGLDKSVKLMGAHRDVLNRIYRARMFVLPSIYEGMPNALMEAMCLGIPVLSSDCPCGGPKELIKDGQNGYLFILNDKTDMLNKMKEILKRDNIDSLRNAEQEICDTHSEDIIFKRWVNYIEKCKKR